MLNRLEQRMRQIAREEIEKAFGVYSTDEAPKSTEENESSVNASENQSQGQDQSQEIPEDDKITLPVLQKRIRTTGKKSGRGRVTKSTDRRLKANKK